MVSNNPPQYIPLIYSYLYMKIKKQMRGNLIAGTSLRKLIQRILLCDKEGSSTKGIPRRYAHDIVKDLVNLKLIEKIGVVHRDHIYKDVNDNVLEVSERLKDWEISAKLRKDKNVKKELSIALKILDKDPTYRVLKSQCDKQLKQAFW